MRIVRMVILTTFLFVFVQGCKPAPDQPWIEFITERILMYFGLW
jgi:hypothetical protein